MRGRINHNTSFKRGDLRMPSNERADNNNNMSELPGIIATFIGTGTNARSSIVVITIIFCFIVGIILSITQSQEDVINVWSIFCPIITLALGYIFGRNEK